MDDANALNLAAFARSRRSKNRSERTIQNYEESLLQLVDWLDGGDLMEAEKADIEDWMTHLLTEHAATTAGVRFRGCRAFYNWAVGEEIIDQSPMAKMSEPKPDDVPPAIVPDEDLKALLKVCQGPIADFITNRDTAIIRLFCEPGSPRIAEMAAIRLDGLDLRRGVVRVMGKGRKVRDVPFGNRTGTALERYIRARAKRPAAALPELWLGALRKGLPMTVSGIAQMLERRCIQARIPHIHPHQLRHTSAHIWKTQGGSEEDAEALFGWTPGSGMARKYGRSATTERAQKAARRMSPADRL